jgi:hypothetical protein
MSVLPEVDDGSYVCSRCDLPVARINGTWQHAEHADAVACALLFPTNLILDLLGDEDEEDEEPERGGATSAWEHHHGV